MKIIVTLRKLDNWKEKNNLKYKSEWIFFLIKNTHYFVVRTSQHKYIISEVCTKWMVDVITLSNRARHHLCHNKSEQGLVLNNER